MATRLSVRIDDRLERRLREVVKDGRSPSDVVRDALEAYLPVKTSPESAYDAAVRLGIIGCISNAPRDLSTNKKYMEGFGKSNSGK